MSGHRAAIQASTGPSLAGLPTDPAQRGAVAAEYVLGTLDTATATRVGVALAADPAWRADVTAWEARLAPIAILARPESPPPNVWDRVEARIAPAEVMKLRRRRQFGRLWLSWAVIATIGAIGLAVFAFFPKAEPPRLMTVLGNDRNLPGVLVEIDPRGNMRFTWLPATTGRQLQSPAGRTFHVWAVVPGAAAPVSLAVLPHEPGRQLVIPGGRFQPNADVVIEVTLEPEGGSPTGVPSGPIILIGRLGYVGADI